MTILPPLVLPTFGGSGGASPGGPPGPQGPAGPAGPQGDTGATGADGYQGAQGDTGPAGPAGPPGPEDPLTLTGDVTGTTDANVVSKLQGLTLTIPPSQVDGQVLTWNDDEGKITLEFPPPFTSPSPLPTPPGPITIVTGTTIYDTTNNTPYWWNGTAWQAVPLSGDVTGTTDTSQIASIQGRNIDLSTLVDGGVITWSNANNKLTLQPTFQSTILYGSLSGPINNPNTGDAVQFNVTQTGPSTYVSYAGGGNFTLVFTGPGPNVSFKLTASLGSLYDGSFTYQWWNVTNNAGLGNVAGSVGGGPSLDAVAVIPYTASNLTITVALQLTYVNGTTFIGENTAGGFILPWAVVETIGIPQDIGV
jgi:hypothetical protein